MEMEYGTHKYIKSTNEPINNVTRKTNTTCKIEYSMLSNADENPFLVVVRFGLTIRNTIGSCCVRNAIAGTVPMTMDFNLVESSSIRRCISFTLKIGISNV